MPIEPFIPLISTGVNAISNAITNKIQRKNSLEDWNRQNEYNSPSAQMARYKAAGLNPNLIYGQSNVSQPVRSTDMVAPQIDPQAANVTAISQNLKQQRVQTDNLELQKATMDASRRLTEANIKLADANTLKTFSDTNLKNISAENLKSLFPYQLQGQIIRNENLGQSTSNMIESNTRANDANTRAWEQNERQKGMNNVLIQKIKSDMSLNPIKQSLMMSHVASLAKSREWGQLTSDQQAKAAPEILKVTKATEALRRQEINNIQYEQIRKAAEMALKQMNMGAALAAQLIGKL